MTRRPMNAKRILGIVVWQTGMAVPFGVFFNLLYGEGFKTLPSFFLVSLIFSYVIRVSIWANRTLILPRILRASRFEGRPALILEIGSFGLAAMVGSVVSFTIMNLTFGHGHLATGKLIATFFAFSLLFSALFLGWVYAMRFHQNYTDRIRAEAEANAKEEQELRIAGEIQRGLQPGRPRVTRTFDLPGGRLGFALGDVAGKGPPAALLAAMVQGVFTSHVDHGFGPAGTMERVNRVLNGRIVEGRFATVFYAVLSPDGKLLSCNAGNNPPYLVSRDGSVRRLEKGGLPIGPFTEPTYEEEETPLREGDTLILYSDGVSDAADSNDEAFGEERLLRCLNGACALEPEKLIEHVLGEVRAFAADRPQFDDITLLVVRYAGG